MKTLIIALSLSLGLCATASAQTTLSLYTWRAQEKALWDEINRQQLIPGIEVETRAVLYDSYPAHIELELQNRRADLFQWAPGASSLKPLIDRDLIRPYRGDLSQMNASALLASTGPDGQLYGVPFALQLQALLVNGKLVDKHRAGGAPQSMSELYQRFDKLKAAGVTPLHLAGGADWFVSQLLGEVMMAGLVDEDFAVGLIRGDSCFSDSRYRVIFDTLKLWRDKGYINRNAAGEDYGAMNNSVALGNSAMAIDGGWKTGASSNFYQVDPSFRFDFWTIPGAVNKVYALGDGTYQVGATSRHRRAAERVLAFTATKKFAELFAQYVNELPAYGGKVYIKPGVLKQMADLVAAKTYSVSLFTAYELNRGQPSYNDLLIKAARAVLDGSKTPEQAAQAIQTGLNSWRYLGYKNCR